MPSRLSGMGSRVWAGGKRADDFYKSDDWKALKARRRKDRDYFAALRRAAPGERVMLDHIVERKDGGADLDPANTQWLTHSEHNRKTAQAKAARAIAPREAWGGGRKSTSPAT